MNQWLIESSVSPKVRGVKTPINETLSHSSGKVFDHAPKTLDFKLQNYAGFVLGTYWPKNYDRNIFPIKTVFFNTPMLSPNLKLLVKCNDVGHLPTKIWLYDSDMNMCMNLHISSFCWRNKSHSNTTIIPEDKRKMFY